MLTNLAIKKALYFALAILEAMACGTPVIVSDRCGLAEAVSGQAGLVTPCDREQLKKAILHMLEDGKMRQEFGEKGRLLVREKFNWEKIAGSVESLYRGILHL